MCTHRPGGVTTFHLQSPHVPLVALHGVPASRRTSRGRRGPPPQLWPFLTETCNMAEVMTEYYRKLGSLSKIFQCFERDYWSWPIFQVYKCIKHNMSFAPAKKEITDPFLAWWSSPKRSKAALSIPKCAKPCGNTQNVRGLEIHEKGGKTVAKRTRLISDCPWLWSINSCSQCIAAMPLLRLLGSSTGHHSIVKLVSCLE